MSIGSNVRRMRRAKDLTQDQLAEKLGLSRAVIIQVEKNIRIPDVAVAKALVDELGCSAEELGEEYVSAVVTDWFIRSMFRSCRDKPGYEGLAHWEYLGIDCEKYKKKEGKDV